MSADAKRGLGAVVAGLLFGAGLAVAGMLQPARVIGFLDPFGAWDPTLALVMVGAIGVHAAVYRAVRGRGAPLLDRRWWLPTRSDVDLKLVLGAALFGVGWGLGGLCPGPGIASLVTGGHGALVFIAALVTASLATSRLERSIARPAGAAPATPSREPVERAPCLDAPTSTRS